MHKLYDFMEARERLSTITVKTKLLHSDVFSDESGNDVYIKPENLQITGSFKVRGAYNKIAKLTEEEKARGVIAASAGNHAQGVALAAKRLGIKATIVMPKHTPLIKVNATKQYGAEVVLHGEIYDEAYQKAMELQQEHGRCPLPPGGGWQPPGRPGAARGIWSCPYGTWWPLGMVRLSDWISDHPRACGANLAHAFGNLFAIGSSPRVRGKLPGW